MWQKTAEFHRKSDTLAALARAQHGVVTAPQLVAAGLGEGAIAYRLSTGDLRRVHSGVYCVAYVPRTGQTRLMAAVLACGEGAVLSHRSAACLWDLVRGAPRTVHVTARNRHARQGVTAHRTRRLPASDITEHEGIPTTTVARTLVDIARELDDRALARAVNEARLLHGLTPAALAGTLRRVSGEARLKRLLVASADRPTRSALEDEFLRFAARRGLPQPEVNRRIAGSEVDMLWRAQRLAVELDGRRYHDTERGFELDRVKDAELLAAGYRVVRITWARLTGDPMRVERLLRRLLR